MSTGQIILAFYTYDSGAEIFALYRDNELQFSGTGFEMLANDFDILSVELGTSDMIEYDDEYQFPACIPDHILRSIK